jgi:hypothetical protein
VTKQQQQQPQNGPPKAGNRCGGVSFFDTPIMDTKTGRRVHMFRCKACENMQWSPDDNPTG